MMRPLLHVRRSSGSSFHGHLFWVVSLILPVLAILARTRVAQQTVDAVTSPHHANQPAARRGSYPAR